VRVLFVARTRYLLPLEDGVARKFNALGAVMNFHVLATARAGSSLGDPLFSLVRPRLNGAFFYLLLPFRVARMVSRFRPDVVMAQSPYEAYACLAARRLTRKQLRVIVDIHGDWRTATRLYGSGFRRLLSPLTDRLARSAILRVDGIRTISAYTSGLVAELGRAPDATFPGYSDLSVFTSSPPKPLPASPTVLFVGVLERYKNVDTLAAAWRLVARQMPAARLVVVGDGSRRATIEELLHDLPAQTTWAKRLPPAGVARALDDASALVLPSASEGLGRVVTEAFCRGRPVIGSRVGGIVDIVTDGSDGVLVEPGDVEALAAAMMRLLRNPQQVAALSARAAATAQEWIITPAEYAEHVRELAVAVITRTGGPAKDAALVMPAPIV
jgi:glycosyltransferase involved in cell wall biosynthesis